jgi:hypothetical protein
MSTIASRTVAAAAFALIACIACAAFAQSSLHVTPSEVAQLPRFCWAQLEVPGVSGPEFHIANCGPGANHYCSALIYMLRARTRGPKNERLGLLGQAEGDLRYTEQAIGGYPNCSIKDHVAGTRSELNSLLRLYRGPPKAK